MLRTAEEYRIVTTGAGWTDLASRGRLWLSGADAAGFLHALVTNDIASLAAGQGAYAAYLTPQGRMICDMTVYRRPDGLLLDVEPGVGTGLRDRLDALIFSEDVQVADASAKLSSLLVAGPASARTLSGLLALDEPALDALVELACLDWRDGFVSRGCAAGVPIFRVFGPKTSLDELAAEFQRAQVERVSDALMEILRIESGRARFGVDMTAETIPLEAGLLDRAISTSKGCYVGQEVIIRVLHRGGGRVAKRLVTLSFTPADAPPPGPGAALFHDDRGVGRVTSVADSPRLGAIGLGYVHRDAAVDGATLGVADGAATARITGFAS